ncbi:hypothetical protein PUNSTDRAFT_123191 [Punctularia strigosozonata HHB-11173 SS5]|uniref:Ubiquitin 3 binding protein But2 C-terminal domain-containing protein n=1 Tax=Punctularia strigosozonata (strain HHB-11173) TaxID=741275 RepID=R7S1Q4_PUNST|nr:uncharacterized protein PUNSTDRAFT_123191 [Punctularia strigosozonata HHB-11173 SS5]EIN03769.1 hypothetical protein PUNSTDRAFT_123191 [Punctularia strigosozonata HHB-11173 SS5]
MQFRVHDYGLENCSIQSVIPAMDRMGDKTFTSARTTSMVEVWHLVDDELEPMTLSWNQRPARRSLFARLNITVGQRGTTPFFPCRTAELQTFEFACELGASEDDCWIDFVQDRGSPLLAIQMFQHAGFAS